MSHLYDSDDPDDSDKPEEPDKTPTPKAPEPDSSLQFSPPKTPLIPTQTKPTILDPDTWSPPQPLQPILAYTFPSGISNWTIPVRAAAFVDITPSSSETFTPVGMVEMGANPETETESHLYLVSIDLTSTATNVQGQLLDLSSSSSTDTLDVTFLRIPQRLNPERTNSPYEAFQGLPTREDNMATIFADGVCFEIKVANSSGNGEGDDSDDDSDEGENEDANGSTNGSPIYNAYCSQANPSDSSAAPLSVMDNFSSQYAELQGMISDVAARFDLADRLQMDQVISTIESIPGIQDCASVLTEESCGSDIIAAPLSEEYVRQQLHEAFGGSGDDNGENGDDDNGEENGQTEDLQSQIVSKATAGIAASDDSGNKSDSKDDDDRDNDDSDNDDGGKGSAPPSSPRTPIEVAVVKVLKPIETPNSIVQPGDYLVHWWFDSNMVFYAVTLTGVTTDNAQVTNQQIPGVPASLIDRRTTGPRQPASQISAWKLKVNAFGREFRVCCWWEGC